MFILSSFALTVYLPALSFWTLVKNLSLCKAIIAMPSITNKGVSKISDVLTEGAGVVTTRNHIHWFVTENGAVDLYGKSLQERARLIISVAHPSAQEALDEAAFNRYGSHHHYIKGYMAK